ncbi:MAG TPA: hypothetical protein VN106_09085 [Sphingomicrobium sp.]|nr:hypothetical protein [Sphingomicrobium sp.]
MIDEIFDRTYQAGRTEMNATISSALRTLAAALLNAFEVLNRIEYHSPWTERASKGRCN